MPSATNQPLAVYARLRTLFEAWPALTTAGGLAYVAPGNRIWANDTAKPQPDLKSLGAKAVADVPEVKLEITNSREDTRGGMRTFCLQPDVHEITYAWTLLGPDKTYNALTQIEAELKACMIAAGVQLGTPDAVARWSWGWRAGDAPASNSGGTRRRQINVEQRVVVKG